MDTRKLKHILNTCSQPYILMLIGPPLSGKDTALKQMNLDAVMISRDQILMDVYGSTTMMKHLKMSIKKKLIEF